MKKITLLFVLFLFCLSRSPEAFSAPAGKDSLRVDTVLGTLQALVNTLETDIVPKASDETKPKLASATAKLKKMVASAETSFQAKKKSTFIQLKGSEKKIIHNLDSQVVKLKALIPQKSEFYQPVAKAYIAIYKATQEMSPESKKPLVSTYSEAYDPNQSRNRQVTLLGAYMNFDTEYRITVGGMVFGPDIVDPERLVFTFPEKLLEGMTEPTYVEVKASPKMQKGRGKNAKVEPYKEQTIYVLVLPVKN